MVKDNIGSIDDSPQRRGRQVFSVANLHRKVEFGSKRFENRSVLIGRGQIQLVRGEPHPPANCVFDRMEIVIRKRAEADNLRTIRQGRNNAMSLISTQIGDIITAGQPALESIR